MMISAREIYSLMSNHSRVTTDVGIRGIRGRGKGSSFLLGAF